MAFRLPLYIQTGSSIPPIITEFTASDTWTKPAGLSQVFIVCVGGGDYDDVHRFEKVVMMVMVCIYWIESSL